MSATVVAVCRSRSHKFSKSPEMSIRLIEGQGVEGDAHSGETVKHRSRVRVDPSQPNLRQVHLVHVELHEALQAAGFEVGPGDIGENITTRGIDLLGLPTGAMLRIGATVAVRITGLRNPCSQLDGFQKGLMAAVLERTPDGKLIRKSGVMGVVLTGGEIFAGDAISVELPPEPHLGLSPV